MFFLSQGLGLEQSPPRKDKGWAVFDHASPWCLCTAALRTVEDTDHFSKFPEGLRSSETIEEYVRKAFLRIAKKKFSWGLKILTS